MALELQFRSCVHFHGNGKKINNSFSSGKFDHKTRYNSNPKRKQESTNGLSWGFMTQGGRMIENRSGVSTTTGKCFGRW